MYDKLETTVWLKNSSINFDNKITAQLIPTLTIFEESEIKPIGTILRNKNDRIFLILYDNRIQINAFKIESLNDYFEKVQLCVDTIIENLDIKNNPFQFTTYIYGSFKAGKPFFNKLVSIPNKLADLGEVTPSSVVLNVNNDNLHYMMLLQGKPRGLDYSLKFRDNFDGFNKDFYDYLDKLNTFTEGNILPNLIRASSNRG